ncbi:hypothetical protein [Aneurinibacillus sp. UBA3580]|jgi:hypothetical protein|uniref:hypothetical protein n=1 Tax=Aneurinibacillus sp. UBA3580 TaxID=1946041 RepID=UPI00257EDD23|nr:hypothetical protein [Aneurinibacillus sp. UBA3580]
MNTSLKEMRIISHEELEKRIEEVQLLQEKERERYALVKDTSTGEHYVRYTQHHLNLMEGGIEEVFDHLLPLDTDDVLAVVFGEQDYTYPAQWTKTYLRGSNSDPYIWFDPSDLPGDLDDDAAGREISEMLDAFKQEKKFDDESIQRLFKQIDDMLGDKK